MSALHPAQFGEQLDMLRPARDLMKIPGDFQRDHADEGWAQKLHESKEPMDVLYRMGRKKRTDAPSLHDDIRQHGIRWPVNVKRFSGGPQVNDGHHRIAVAHDIDPDYLVPVTHS